MPQTKDVNVELALNVMNHLRRLSQGKQGISSNDLADAILHERIAHPQAGIKTVMRTRVYAIVKTYFPYAKPETPVKLGEGNSKAPPQETLKVAIIDRDALILSLLKFISDCGASDMMPDDLMNTVKQYVAQRG